MHAKKIQQHETDLLEQEIKNRFDPFKSLQTPDSVNTTSGFLVHQIWLLRYDKRHNFLENPPFLGDFLLEVFDNYSAFDDFCFHFLTDYNDVFDVMSETL